MSGREGRGELFLAGLQANEWRVATQTPLSLFTSHCSLYEKCPFGVCSPTTPPVSLHPCTTHCKLIQGIPNSIYMKCTQKHREVIACPSRIHCAERESHRERERGGGGGEEDREGEGGGGGGGGGAYVCIGAV